MDPDLQAAAQALGVSFRDPSLLRLSLTHSSYVNEHPQDAPVSNERLEYLGTLFWAWWSPGGCTWTIRPCPRAT